jgi:hypothetical protein
MPRIGSISNRVERRALWRAVRPAAVIPVGRWFATRFLDASAVVVRRWGPAWSSRHHFLGRELGVWILTAVWLAGPMGLALRLLRRLLP